MNGSRLLRVGSVTKTYGGKGAAVTALADVSFDLGSGEILRLTGPSGSGKTTLLNLIAALDRPDSGEIVVAETEVTRLSPTEAARYRAERVGIIFQSYNLLPQLTALENVMLPTILLGRRDDRRARQLLDEVGLADRCAHRPSQLSGGEQQRVAIARALINDPPFLLADEPTGNLDDENARIVMAMLSDLCRRSAKALILVTHDRGQAADAVYELRAGVLTPGAPRATAGEPAGARRQPGAERSRSPHVTPPVP
jgi:ABC-type lipoprotein export system ATPase subunit